MAEATFSFQSKPGIRRGVDEIIGAVFGVLGALLVSTDGGLEFVGFISWFVSNVALIVFSVRIRSPWLLGMNLAFMATTLNGLVNFYPG